MGDDDVPKTTRDATADAASRWRSAAVATALTVVIVGVATLAGSLGGQTYEWLSGALEPGSHPPGEVETLTAARLGSYFAAFQMTAILATAACVPLLRRFVPGNVVPLHWPRRGFLVIFLAAIGLLAIAITIGLIIYRVDQSSLTNDMRPFAAMARSQAWWVLLLAAAIGAPLAEEFLFRGFLYSGLRASPLGFLGTVAITSLFWAVLHMDYSLDGVIMVLVIGAYFAWLRERSGSVWPSIGAHAIYNGLIVLALSAGPQGALA